MTKITPAAQDVAAVAEEARVMLAEARSLLAGIVPLLAAARLEGRREGREEGRAERDPLAARARSAFRVIPGGAA